MGSHVKSRIILLRRAAASVTALGLAAAGALVVTTAPAYAQKVETPYGFEGSVFGTRVISGEAGLRSGRSAWSPLSCTQMAGLVRKNYVATVQNHPQIHISGVESRNVTYRRAKRGVVGIRGINTVADVRLAGSDEQGAPSLSLEGLATRTHVWRDSDRDRFGAATTFSSADIDLVLAPETPIDKPLNDLLDGVQDGIGGVLDALTENGGQIEVPGLGTIHRGWQRNIRRPAVGVASGYMLRVVLADGTEVQIGRSWSKMVRDLPAGPMGGGATAVQIDALAGIIKSGRISTQPLPCQGTGDRIKRSRLVGANPGNANALVVDGARASAWGVQHPDGSARGWTEAKIARVELGDGAIVLDAITARANIRQLRNGTVRKSAQGTSLGSLTVPGMEAQEVPIGEDFMLPGGEGVARIETGLIEKSARGIRVTAVKVTLFENTPGEIVVRLGRANAFIKRR